MMGRAVSLVTFSQGDNSTTRKFGGTGLGTTISKQLVELMGGRLIATSEIGIGSCFTMILPLPTGSAQTAPTSLLAHALPAMRILVADDIRQNLDLISILLGRDGHQITTASDGLEAVELFNQHIYDLIIMDVQMPQLDGLNAAAQIRMIETEKNVTRTPIIALTASVLQEDRAAAFEAGMDGFATKPVDIKALTREMMRVLHVDTALLAEDTSVPTHQIPAHDAVINVEKGLALWGSEPLYRQELARIAADIPLQMSRLTTALNNHEAKSLAALAHASKGVCGNLALPALYMHFTTLEKQALADDLNGAVSTMQTIASAWEAFKLQLAAQMAALPASAVALQTTNYDAQALQTLLTALTQAAQQAEIDDQRLQALSSMAPAQYLLATQQIVNAFNDFEFDVAAERIAQLQTLIQHGAHS